MYFKHIMIASRNRHFNFETSLPIIDNLSACLHIDRDFAYVAREKTSKKHMCHVFRCDTPARQIANALRDICKKIMMERRHQENSVVQRLSRPTDLPMDKSSGTNGQKMSFQSLYNSKYVNAS